MTGYQIEKPKAKADFSKKAITKAVTQKGIQHPLVLYPGAIGILGLAATILLGPSIIPVTAAIAGGVISIGSLVVNLLMRKEAIANEYIINLRQATVENLERSKSDLKQYLYSLKNERAFTQLEKLEDKFDLLERILSKKLNPSEISFKRYLGIAEQVLFSVMDSLQELGNRAEAIKAIDIKYIENRLKQLSENENLSNEALEEKKSLEKRKKIFQDQQKEIEQILSKNESALTVIDETTAAISGITTKRGRSTVDLETAMKELGELADRADDYSIKD